MKNDEKWVKYGKLLSGLIHNLNTPLMGISGRVELLQIKMGEDKSLIQINSQVERITAMLTATGYFVDKDQYDKPTEIDLAVFMENYVNFLYTDMRFKHHSTNEKEFVTCKVTVNPSDLLFIIHSVTDYLLEFLDEETVFTFKNTETFNVYVSMKTKKPISSGMNINNLINEKLSVDELKKNFEIIAGVMGNEAEVKVKVIPVS